MLPGSFFLEEFFASSLLSLHHHLFALVAEMLVGSLKTIADQWHRK